jgi:hypothetical protein
VYILEKEKKIPSSQEAEDIADVIRGKNIVRGTRKREKIGNEQEEQRKITGKMESQEAK